MADICTGWLQCFDATDTVNLSRPALHQQNSLKNKEPQWSRATGTFLYAPDASLQLADPRVWGFSSWLSCDIACSADSLNCSDSI